MPMYVADYVVAFGFHRPTLIRSQKCIRDCGPHECNAHTGTASRNRPLALLVWPSLQKSFLGRSAGKAAN